MADPAAGRLHFEARADRLRAMIDSAERQTSEYNEARDHFLTGIASNELQRRNALEGVQSNLDTLQEQLQTVQTAVDKMTSEFRKKMAEEGLRCTDPHDEKFEEAIREAAAAHHRVKGYRTTKEDDPEPVKPAGFHFKKIGPSEIIFGFISGLFLAISIASRFGWLNLISLRHGQFDPMSLIALLLGCATTIMAGQMAMGTVRGILLLDEFAKTSQRILMGIFALITVLFVAGEISIEAGGLQLFGQMLEDLRALQFHTHRVEVPIWGYILMAFIASAIYIGLRANTAYHATLPEVEYKGALKDWKNRKVNRDRILSDVQDAVFLFREANKGVRDAAVLLAAIDEKRSELDNRQAEVDRVTRERDRLNNQLNADPQVVSALISQYSTLQINVERLNDCMRDPGQLQALPNI